MRVQGTSHLLIYMFLSHTDRPSHSWAISQKITVPVQLIVMHGTTYNSIERRNQLYGNKLGRFAQQVTRISQVSLEG